MSGDRNIKNIFKVPAPEKIIFRFQGDILNTYF